MSKKMKLEDLIVQSFVTALNNNKSATILGGDTGPTQHTDCGQDDCATGGSGHTQDPCEDPDTSENECFRP